MSEQTPRESDSLIPSQRQCCRLSYKPRKFSSKGAVLILAWQFFVGSSLTMIDLNMKPSIQGDQTFLVSNTIGIAAFIISAIISGWLAGTKIGRAKVVQAGIILSWIGALLFTVDDILTQLQVAKSTVLFQLNYFISVITTGIGGALFVPNIIQFGLEQMPDASSDALTAFISWFTIVCYLGLGASETLRSLFICLNVAHDTHRTFTSLVRVTLLSIAMCSKFLFRHWLIDHRQNHNPLKTVYRVLRFAKQHKYPVNRSAFTYCEDEIPSRIDLGKSKYGGPFTTEEVEDVKTFFRIIAIFVVLTFSVITVTPAAFVEFPPFDVECYVQFIYRSNGLLIVAIFVTFEYAIYPFIKRRYRLNMLKTIGFFLLLSFCFSVSLLTSTLLQKFGLLDLNTFVRTHPWIIALPKWLIYISSFIFMRTLMQFIYSQAPEHMKSFFVFWAWCFLSLIGVPEIGFTNKVNVINLCSKNKNCGVYIASAVAPLNLLVFVVYCCVARWYKRRERDEPCNERARIEEIYGRHVEHNIIEGDSN